MKFKYIKRMKFLKVNFKEKKRWMETQSFYQSNVRKSEKTRSIFKVKQLSLSSKSQIVTTENKFIFSNRI